MKERSWRRSTMLTGLTRCAGIERLCDAICESDSGRPVSVTETAKFVCLARLWKATHSQTAAPTGSTTNRGSFGWCPIGACLARARGSPSKERSAKGSTWGTLGDRINSAGGNRVGPGNDGVVTQSQELKFAARFVRHLRSGTVARRDDA